MTDKRYPLSWPTGRPRTPAASRDRAPFGSMKRVAGRSYESRESLSVAEATSRLQVELDRLGAREIVLSTNVEPRLDGYPRSDRREPADSGAALYFRFGGKDTVLACDKWDRTADNIAAIAKHLEALRGMDRWGVGTLEQAFAGYQALPAPEQWWQVLGVPESASREHINAAWRDKANTAHPDKGGSDAAMARLNAARDDGLRRLP